MNNRKKTILFFFIAFFCFIFNSSYVEAASCIICDGDPNTYKMEQQFAKRINIIKKIGGRKIDDVVLAATVLHKENAFEAVQSRYDENFDEKTFKEQWVDFKNNANSRQANVKDKDGNDVSSEQVDLLTAAAIVMWRSAVNNVYNEENYKEALASDALFTNDQSIINSLFCGAGAGIDAILTLPNLTGTFLTGGSVSEEIKRTGIRWYNMIKICNNGYIGGIYDATKESMPDDNVRSAYKNRIASEIIDLSNYYKKLRGEIAESCAATTSGSFSTWKQFDPEWGSVSLNSGTLSQYGCLITSLAMQIARSGTQITNLPNGYNSFNPGAFATSLVNNGGVNSGASFTGSGWDDIAPFINISGDVQAYASDTATLAHILSEELSEPADGKYQKYIVIRIRDVTTSQHWIAIDSVSGNEVTIFDPAMEGNTLDENYSSWEVTGYKVVYATDVENGGTSSANLGLSSCGSGSGEIIIPEEYGNGGFTVTYYANSDNSWTWARASNQGNLYYNYWLTSGANYDNGIATYEDRYLIACTETFGSVGDKIDFYLEDGTKIPCIIADIKSSSDAGYNEWGHNNGQNVLEFEVSKSYMYNENGGGNPGTGSWFPEWGGKRVASATNLGSIFDSMDKTA